MLRGVAETLWSARSDDELIAVVEQAQRPVLGAGRGRSRCGRRGRPPRGLAKDKLHYGSTGDWLTHTGGLRRGEGKRRVVRAHALTGPLTRTRAALVAGEVSATQVDPILDAVHGLPSGELVRARGEQAMLEHAQSLDATELARLGRHLAHVVDPDQEDRRLEAALDREDRAAHLNRFLAITEDRAGGVRIKGYGSTEDAALLKAALLPLTCPTPHHRRRGRGGGEVRDPRDHGARLWDALITTAHHALTTAPAAGDPRHPTPTPGHPRPPDPPRPARRPRDRHHRGRRRALTRHACGGWPATPRSSPPSSAPAARSSTSAAPDARSPPSSGPPWCCGTGTAPSPAAPDPR